MRKSRFTDAQIVGVLHEHEAGAKIAELCRRHGVTETAFHRWKRKYGGLQSEPLSVAFDMPRIKCGSVPSPKLATAENFNRVRF